MDKGKEEILGNLYTLRAGLSLVSIEKDKVDSRLSSVITKNRAAKKEADDLLACARGKLDSAQNDAVSIEKELKTTLSVKDLVSESKTHFLFTLLDMFIVCLSVFCVLIFIWAIGGFFVSCKDYNDLSDFQHKVYDWSLHDDVGGDWLPFVVLILFIAALPGAVGCIILLVKVIAHQKDYRSIIGIFGLLKARKRTKAKLAKALSVLKSAQQNCEIAENDFRISKKKNEDELIISIDKLIPKIQFILLLIDSLESTFKSFISNRDWGNVDLIIYYVETSRADNMKEALLLVDRERQTQRIIQSVELATKEISQTLNTCFTRLQGSMERGFNLLSNQIAANTRLIAGKMDGIMSQNSKISLQLQNNALNMITATNMTNALLAKSNVSSANIAEGVGQIKDYVNHLEMLKRNGVNN